MSDSAPFSPRENVLFTPLSDGTGVLLDLRSKNYFTLNSTGAFVWQELAKAPRTAQELATLLTEAFEVSLEVAAGDLNELLDELLDAALLSQSGN